MTEECMVEAEVESNVAREHQKDIPDQYTDALMDRRHYFVRY